MPLILLDKITGNRTEIPYKAKSAGYGMTAMSIESEFWGNYEETRIKLAVGYMLLFHFSKFAENDPIMDPKGIWNSYSGGWLRSEHFTMGKKFLRSLPDYCQAKYRLVIEQLRSKGAFESE